MTNNPSDLVRQQILKYFYDRNANATSERGKRGSHVKISDIKKELKALHGLSQQQVTAQLTYLLSSGWVAKIADERTFTTAGGTQIPRSQEWYVITAAGIDRIEGSSSTFMRQNPYSNVNITAVNSAVQLGSGNVVNESFVGLAEELDRLSKAVASSAMAEEEKLSIIADIETINGQLAKPMPHKAIVKAAWDAVTSSKAAALIQSGSRIMKAIETIIG